VRRTGAFANQNLDGTMTSAATTLNPNQRMPTGGLLAPVIGTTAPNQIDQFNKNLIQDGLQELIQNQNLI